MLEKVVEIAASAGSIVMEYYGKKFETFQKAGNSPVTEADQKANAYIVTKLTELAPKIPVISEEAELPSFEERKNWSDFWLVDPLDGTTEFIKKLDEFTVNIALIRGGEPVLGVVYAPARGLMYYAEKGKGSWRKGPDGKVVRIYSGNQDPKGALRVVASRSHVTPELEQFLKTIEVSERVSAGSSLKFCLVAEGSADIYPRLGPTMEWDVAAGDCVYRNSAPQGQRTTTLRYNKPDLKNGNFILGYSTGRSG